MALSDQIIVGISLKTGNVHFVVPINADKFFTPNEAREIARGLMLMADLSDELKNKPVQS